MPSPKTIGPYRYQLHDDGPLTETNMSVLWLADESDPQQRQQEKVVLKLARLKEEQFSLTNQRAIQNEVNWLRKLHHPGVVKLRPIAQLQSGRTDQEIYHARGTTFPGEPWFVVTDYLPGGTLQQLVEERKKLSTPLALQIARQLATTLAYIHTQRCVHRDFKPNNVLFVEKPEVQRLGRRSQPILIDFGIANELGEEKSVAGTVPWLAPECRRARQAGTRLVASPAVDVFALGLVLYYMVTGKRPPEAATNLPTVLRIDPGMLIDVPAHRQNQVAVALTQVIARTVADDPERRGPAQQMVNDLDALLTLLRPAGFLEVWLRGLWDWVGSRLKLRRGRKFGGRWHWLGGVGVAGLLALSLYFANLGPAGEAPQANPEADAAVGATLSPTAIPPATVTPLPPDTPTSLPVGEAPATLPSTPTVVPAVTATVLPTATALPTNPAPAATLPGLATATATLAPTVAPTSTPLPSATPTRSPTPTAAVATETPRPTSGVVDSGGGVTLLEPLNSTLAGVRDFRWTSTVTLVENQAYEMVFWRVGQDPLTVGFGPVGARSESTIRVDLDRAATLLPHLLIPGQDYEWGVLLVQLDPYLRLRYLGGKQPFRFEVSGDGGGSQSGGDDNKPSPGQGEAEKPTPTPRG